MYNIDEPKQKDMEQFTFKYFVAKEDQYSRYKSMIIEISHRWSKISLRTVAQYYKFLSTLSDKEKKVLSELYHEVKKYYFYLSDQNTDVKERQTHWFNALDHYVYFFNQTPHSTTYQNIRRLVLMHSTYNRVIRNPHRGKDPKKRLKKDAERLIDELTKKANGSLRQGIEAWERKKGAPLHHEVVNELNNIITQERDELKNNFEYDQVHSRIMKNEWGNPTFLNH